jgi:ribosome-associated protein
VQDHIVDRWPITLVQALKLCGLAESGAEAKSLVEEGEVRVNGEPEGRKRRQLAPGDVVERPGLPPVRLVVGPGDLEG